MAKKENQSPILSLNGKEYDVNSDLNDEQKQMYLQAVQHLLQTLQDCQ